MKHSLRYIPMLLAVVLIGCGDKKTPTDNNDKEPPAKSQPVEEDLGGPLEGEPTVEVWDWEQTLETVHEHQGKVVVLHIWASWNEDLDDPANQGSEGDREKQQQLLKLYGFEEFIRLKKLHRDDVVAISLNADYNYDNQDQPPERLKDRVMSFVKSRRANFQHGVSSVLEEPLYEELGIITTPAALVFDKKGELRHTFFHDEKPFSYRGDVIPAVKKLLKEDDPPAPKPEDEEVHLEIRDWEGLQQLVTEAKGRVVVVDLWSTQCTPCLKEFPNLVQLHNERKDDVACLSFNMDYIGKGNVDDLKDDVLAVLKQQKATFPNVMSNESDDDIYAKIESFSIPVVHVYDRQGQLRKRFDDDLGEFTYEKDILPFVETLIEEKSAP